MSWNFISVGTSVNMPMLVAICNLGNTKLRKNSIQNDSIAKRNQGKFR